MKCIGMQGFPDGWTDIRDATPDTLRYQALGNSVAAPAIRWLGERMQEVDEVETEDYGRHAGSTDDEPSGCSNGCLVLCVACIAIDAIIAWALLRALSSIVWFVGWLLSLMASS